MNRLEWDAVTINTLRISYRKMQRSNITSRIAIPMSQCSKGKCEKVTYNPKESWTILDLKRFFVKSCSTDEHVFNPSYTSKLVLRFLIFFNCPKPDVQTSFIMSSNSWLGLTSNLRLCPLSTLQRVRLKENSSREFFWRQISNWALLTFSFTNNLSCNYSLFLKKKEVVFWSAWEKEITGASSMSKFVPYTWNESEFCFFCINVHITGCVLSLKVRFFYFVFQTLKTFYLDYKCSLLSVARSL